jgi:hypothetical protein
VPYTYLFLYTIFTGIFASVSCCHCCLRNEKRKSLRIAYWALAHLLVKLCLCHKVFMKLRRWTWLMYFLYKNEYRIFKLVEITIGRRLRKKGEKWRKWINLGYNIYAHGNVTLNFLCRYLKKQKCLFSKTYDRKVKQVMSGGWY